jgi:gamma-glutamyltranspeptidase/glutathione hydrolase
VENVYGEIISGQRNTGPLSFSATAGGFPLVPQVSSAIAAVEQHFREHWPSSATTWLPDGRVPTANHRLPALAATWRKLLAAAVGPTREAQIDAARDAWYRGFVAEEIERFVAIPVRDATGRDHAGLLSADDLAGWSSSYEDALVVEVGGGWAVAKPGPWSQGPVLAQTLQLLRGADLTYADGVPTEATAHLATEAAKLAFADREAWYGDSAPVPLDVLVSGAYADERRPLIGDAASLDLRPGTPAGVPPRLAAATAPGGARGDGVSSAGLGEPTAARAPGLGESTAVRAPGLGEPTAAGPRSNAAADARPATGPGQVGTGAGRGEPSVAPDGVAPDGVVRGDTVHIDVVDAAGNMVSATPSGGWLQSSPTIPALGFCLGTRGQMFWLEDGLASSLMPGRRPRTTLSPSLGLRDGEPVLAFGTPGGDQQDQWQLCFWLAHTVGGLDLQAAIEAPTWHSTAFPSSFAPRGWEPGGLVAESRLGRATIEALRRRGHRVVEAGPWALGRLCAAGRGEILRAAADPRSGYGGAAAF